MVDAVIHITLVSRERDRDPHTQWEECQGHVVRNARVMGDVAETIFEKYNLSLIFPMCQVPLGGKYTPEIKLETTTSTDLAI